MDACLRRHDETKKPDSSDQVQNDEDRPPPILNTASTNNRNPMFMRPCDAFRNVMGIRCVAVRLIKKLSADIRGLAAIEYGLGLALVAIVSITAWGAVGSQGTPEPVPVQRAA
jgi:Flp pilus assembly pilin Flp